MTPQEQAEAMAREMLTEIVGGTKRCRVCSSVIDQWHVRGCESESIAKDISKLIAENESNQKLIEDIARQFCGISQCDPVKSESNDLFHQKGKGFLLRKDLGEAIKSQLTATEAKLKETEAHVLRLRHRNLTNVLSSICRTCGHTTTEDGCAFCIRETISPLMDILNRRVGDDQSGYCGAVMVDDKLKDELNKSRAFLSTLTAEKKESE